MQQIVRSMNPIQRVNRQNSIHVQELVFFKYDFEDATRYYLLPSVVRTTLKRNVP